MPQNVNHPMWNYITQIAPRRDLVVDEERGSLVRDVHVPARRYKPTYTLPSGEGLDHDASSGW